jgi:hypothetical protein
MLLECDLLVIPVKRRRSPRSATPNGADSYLSDTRTPLASQPPPRSGIKLRIFTFAPVGITEVVLVRRPFLDAAFGLGV